MADFHGERTERPSPKRLKDARERGQVATSRDLSLAVGSLAATAALVGTGSFLLHRLSAIIEVFLARMGRSPLIDLGPEDMAPIVTAGGALIALAVGPVALAAATAGVLGAAAQSGFVFAPKALQLKWERLSPATGLKRLAPSRAGIDTVKVIVTTTVLGVLVWRVGRDLTFSTEAMVLTPASGSAARGWAMGMRLLWQAGLALLAVGAADYGIQRWRLWSSLKMTRQEVREEARSTEANPEIRARVRRVQREMVRRRMFHAVPKATVVVTNPTHYAVALQYRREKDVAPVVVAKGRDLVAARIKEIAREHSVPVVENPTLARALFKGCEIGDVIPAPLFSAVAEVLAYLIRIRQLVL